ncbi:hypothetical protein [Gordonia sp. NPDC003429]
MTHHHIATGQPVNHAAAQRNPTEDSLPPHIDTATLPFTSTGELRQRWRALMGPLGFDEPRLWFGVVDDDRLVPPLSCFTLPTLPDPVGVDRLMAALHEITRTGSRRSVAILLTRPGSDGVTSRDLCWAQLIEEAGARHGTRLHPIHRANDIDLITLPNSVDSVA